MSEKAKLLELAERCEQATGPSIGLNDAIFRALNRRFPTRGERMRPAYRVTASLDAAMTLAGDDELMFKRVPSHVPQSRAVVWINGRNVGFEGDAATPALALCAAALRAKSEATHD